MDITLRRPSAYLPIAMSLLALTLVLTQVVLFGTAREPDEGALAHLFQLLVVAQIPIALYHVAHGWRRSRAQSLRVLMLQIAALVLACAPVAGLGL